MSVFCYFSSCWKAGRETTILPILATFVGLYVRHVLQLWDCVRFSLWGEEMREKGRGDVTKREEKNWAEQRRWPNHWGAIVFINMKRGRARAAGAAEYHRKCFSYTLRLFLFASLLLLVLASLIRFFVPSLCLFFSSSILLSSLLPFFSSTPWKALPVPFAKKGSNDNYQPKTPRPNFRVRNDQMVQRWLSTTLECCQSQ